MSFLNFVFCCCFNPLPIYILDQTKALKSFSYTSVNWLYEGKMTKEEFLFRRHKISIKRLWINRLFVILINFLLLYFFPGIIYFTYYIIAYLILGKSIDVEIKKDLRFLSIILCLSIFSVIGIVIYSKLGPKIRFIIFIASLFILFAWIIILVYFFVTNNDSFRIEYSSKTITL